MGYFRQLFSQSFWDAWNVVFAQSVATVMIGVAIFASTLVALRCRKRHDEARNKLRDFGLAALITAGFFFLIFLAYLLVLTPKSFVEAARTERDKAERELRKANAELHAMSPSEQSEEIKRLQSEIKNFRDRVAEEEKREWPPLSDTQIAEWARVLAPLRGNIEAISVLWGQDVEAKKLFWSLQSVGRAAGIPVRNDGGAADNDGKITVYNGNGQLGRAIVELFEKAGYPAVLATGGNTKTVAIFVSDRLTPP